MNGIRGEELRALILSVGTHRAKRPLSPLEVAQMLSRAREGGATVGDCAKAAGIAASQIRAFLSLLHLPPEMQHLADWRGSKNASISFSTLVELARISSRADQNEVVEAILSHRMTWTEVIQLVQILERSGGTVSDCLASVLKQRPSIEIRHLFVGSITSDAAKQSVENLLQTERDELMARVLQNILGGSHQVTGRLGTNRFTVVSNNDLSSLLGLEPDDIEALFNQHLGQGV